EGAAQPGDLVRDTVHLLVRGVLLLPRHGELRLGPCQPFPGLAFSGALAGGLLSSPRGWCLPPCPGGLLLFTRGGDRPAPRSGPLLGPAGRRRRSTARGPHGGGGPE